MLNNISKNFIGQPMFGVMTKAKELEAQGKHLIHFEIGDPKFDTPEEVKEVAIKAITDNKTHYTNPLGIVELREAVREEILKTRGFKPDLDQVLITTANASITYAISCLADKWNGVVIPDPGFPTYKSACKYLGVVDVPVGMDYLLSDFYHLAKVIILNSPNNPTGKVLTKSELEFIYNKVKQQNKFIISDEVYSKIIYDKPFYSIGSIDQCKEHTLIIDSLSKSCAMTGWRIGYAVGPKHIIEKMGIALETTMSCLPEFIQLAAIKALEIGMPQDRLEELKNRRNRLVEGLNKIAGIECEMPDGAFYVFPRVHNSQRFFEEMLNKGVVVLDGKFFGRNGDDYIRMSYASTTTDEIDEALNRMTR